MRKLVTSLLILLFLSACVSQKKKRRQTFNQLGKMLYEAKYVSPNSRGLIRDNVVKLTTDNYAYPPDSSIDYRICEGVLEIELKKHWIMLFPALYVVNDIKVNADTLEIHSPKGYIFQNTKKRINNHGYYREKELKLVFDTKNTAVQFKVLFADFINRESKKADLSKACIRENFIRR